MRTFLQQTDIENIGGFQEIDQSILSTLVGSVNSFLDGYLDTTENLGVTIPNDTTKLAAIKLAKYWGNLESNIKSIKDIDVSITYNVDNDGLTIPPSIEAMIAKYKIQEAVVSGTNSLSFF